MKLSVVLTLCLLSSATTQKSPPRIGPTPGRTQSDCTCSRGIQDCASRGKTTFTRYERCANAVTELLLFNNSISTLPRDAFQSMSEITHLFLQNNPLRQLPKGLFSPLGNLRNLQLHSAQLTTLPEGIFQNLYNLEHIALWGNNLRTIPKRLFAALRKPAIVSIADNQLTTLPADTFSGVRKMVLIDISRNKISHLPRGLFRGFESASLDLTGNQLTQISPEDFISIRRMFRLDVSENKITSIPRYSTQWPEIEFSYWSENNFRTISEEILRSWLGNGEADRVFSMEAYNISKSTFFPPEDVRWTVLDPALSTEVGRSDCRCGRIKLGRATVELCVNVKCGNGRPHADWVSALRSMSNAGGRQRERAGNAAATKGTVKG